MSATEPPRRHPGERVRVIMGDRIVEAVVVLAGGGGHSLFLIFDGMVGGYLGAMPVLWKNDGYFDLVQGRPVGIEDMPKETPKKDIRCAGAAEEFIQGLFEPLRDRFDKRGRITLHAFIFASCNPQTKEPLKQPTVFQVPTPPPHVTKDEWSSTLRALAVASKAFGVAFVDEAWTVEAEESQIDRIRRQGCEHEPGRKEVVMIALEHIDLPKDVRWFAEIIQDPKGRRRLSAFERQESDSSEGRFTHLLRRESWQ